MYKVEFTKEGANSLHRLPKRILSQIKSKIEWLSNNSEVIKHKKLKSDYFEDIFKLRMGDYRILYSIDKLKNLIVIEYTGDRKDIYKK